MVPEFLKHQTAPKIAVELILGGAFLMLPTIVAAIRKSKDLPLIAVCNVIFIYAFEVWLPLMVWAFSGDRNEGLIDKIKGSKKGLAFSIIIMISITVGAGFGTYSLVRSSTASSR
jgi:hypothetical protein